MRAFGVWSLIAFCWTTSATAQINSGPQASNVRCDAPPYGGTLGGYRSFVKNFGQVVEPTRMLEGVCNAKFNRVGRKTFYGLGITDDQIDNTDTSDLAVVLIGELRKLARGEKD